MRGSINKQVSRTKFRIYFATSTCSYPFKIGCRSFVTTSLKNDYIIEVKGGETVEQESSRVRISMVMIKVEKVCPAEEILQTSFKQEMAPLAHHLEEVQS